MVLDAGDALFSYKAANKGIQETDLLKAKTILLGYHRIGCDAINVGNYDMLAGLEFLTSEEAAKLPLISANIRKSSGELAFAPYVTIERGGLKIAVIGVTASIPESNSELTVSNYREAGKEYIQLLRNKSDVVIILANADLNEHKQLKADFVGADYIFVSRYTGMTTTRMSQDDNGPMLYSVGVQGKYLGVIDLEILDANLPITDISYSREALKNVAHRFEMLQKRDPDRKLEEIYADSPNVLQVISDYRQRQEQANKILENAVNTSFYQLIPLENSIPDDDILLELVTKTLDRCADLDRPNNEH